MIRLFFLFLLPPLQLLAQNQKTLSGVVCNDGRRPLAYVSIGMINGACGTVSNAAGAYTLYLPESAQAGDSIRFSLIGYQSVALPVGALTAQKQAPVQLHAVSETLPEVSTRPARPRKLKIGSRHEQTTMTNNFAIGSQPGQNLGSEIGELFHLKKGKNFLEAVNVYINHNTFDTVTFLVNIYSVKNGLPDTNLLGSPVVWELMHRDTGWVSLDLRPCNKVLQQNIIVSLEWVGHSQKGKYLSLPISLPVIGARHYYKFASQGKWRKYHNMSTSINLDVEREE